MPLRRIILVTLLCLALFFSFVLLTIYLTQRGTTSTPLATNVPTISPTAELVILQSAPVLEPTPTPIVIPPTPTPVTEDLIFYTIQPGETLSQIAYKFGLDTESLALANHLSDINLIFAGKQLLISTTPVTPEDVKSSDGKQIIVALFTQRAYIYEDGILLKEFIVATGISAFPTVTGPYQIETKYEKTDMSGPGYYIKDVPWTMYFFKGYGLHGAPWNNNLGTPGSHGCVNMSVEDAHWLFNWASVGTPVLVLP